MNLKVTEFIRKAEELYDSASDQPEFIAWKDDVIRFLKKRYGNVSHEAASFNKIEYYNFFLAADVITGVGFETNDYEEKKLFQKGLKTAILYLKNYEADETNSDKSMNEQDIPNNNKIFIVHGRNGGIKAQVVSFLLKFGIKSIILNEQINKGQTIIEKFEKNSQVKAAVVLFTSDDLGKFKDDHDFEKRARQNVIFEAGYFIGKLGRKYTIFLLEKGLKMPSDLDGYTYFEIDEKQRWHLDIAKELKGIGFDINMNDLI